MRILNFEFMSFRLGLLSAITLFAGNAATLSAANDEESSSPRWAVIAGMNLSCPTTAVNEQSGQYADKAASFGSAQGNVMVEYYLRNPHFSVVGGYNAETMEWYGSDVDVTMHNIALGARYYPLSTACVIQPYAALMTYTNVGKSNERSTMSSTGGGYSYERRYEISSPRVSVAPTVGFDCYIFSSLALELQYGFPLAIDGKTNVSTTYGGQQTAYRMRSDMHRHNIQIGVKATFPLRFTTEDGNSLFRMIYMALGIYDPDDDPKPETKKERRKSSLNKVLNSY
ncbi:hypothetical protein [Prevotella sp.]|uniref:hypothetical protein n=2 Tax=Prevotella sp. TaxID=59823 RepID=UPI0025D127DB|nr:hypothetical protein [Prevotella sp.]